MRTPHSGFDGYRCELIDPANRRPLVPRVEVGETSKIWMSMFNGDALFVVMT